MMARTWFVCSAVLFGFASGCAAEGESAGSSDGQVVAPWDDYCVATFTKDFDIVDSFGDVTLSVAAGDRYLLGDESFSGEATIIYIADKGPVELEVEVDGSALPFTSSCAQGTAQTYIAVFGDVPVYSDAALTKRICTLAAGLAVRGSGINYSVSGGPTFPYQVELKELAPHCNNAAMGFVKSATVTIGTSSFEGVPIVTVLGS